MTKVFVFEVDGRLGSNVDRKVIDFENVHERRIVFKKFSEALQFEITPQEKWDAFIDQMREYLGNIQKTTVVEMRSFASFIPRNIILGIELVEILTSLVAEHYERDENKNVIIRFYVN